MCFCCSFALVIVGSEHSSRNIFERLARKELHGQIPQIMHYSKQALSQFEAQARKGGELPQNGNFRERDRDGTFWFSFHPSVFCFFLGLGMRDLVRVKGVHRILSVHCLLVTRLVCCPHWHQFSLHSSCPLTCFVFSVLSSTSM